MLEISHQQARYLIHEAEDRQLPQEQWAALQAHLERCPECRAYQEQRAGLDKSLTRGLRARWQMVNGPSRSLTPDIVAFRKERAARRARIKHLVSFGFAVFVLSMLVIFGWTLRKAALHSPTPVAMQPAPTATAPSGTGFQGVAAFEANSAGHSQIFLFNTTGLSGPEMTNLTQDESNNTDPAWSPDGEWIAFLSDRTGKKELFVINVAGTRLTQLTDSPDIQWDGQPTWSYDGKWIVLDGLRAKQNNTSWAYLLPIDGSGPRALPGTRNATNQASFSPSQPLIAVETLYGNLYKDLLIYDINTGWHDLASHLFNLPPSTNLGGAGSFDWALGGNSLLFKASGPHLQPESLFLSPVIGMNNRDAPPARQYLEGSQLITGSEDPVYRFVSAQPGGLLMAVEEVGNLDQHCPTIRLYSTAEDGSRLLDLNDLCIDSPLERSSWTTQAGGARKRQWLLVAAHRPQENVPALYALRLPASLKEAGQTPIERLADFPPANLEDSFRSIPRVRPSGMPLDLQPKAASSPVSPVRAVLPPSGLPGTLLATWWFQVGDHSTTVRLSPDGKGSHLVTGLESSVDTCPTLSPDGKTIALVTDRYARAGQPASAFPLGFLGQTEIYRVDIDGKNLKQLTLPLYPAESPSTYDCPVWGPFPANIPSGSSAQPMYMAAVRRNAQRPNLAIVEAETGLARLAVLDSPSRYVLPVWAPDGQAIYLGESASGGGPARIVTIPWRSLGGAITLLTLTGWEDVQALSVSPDNRWLALIAVRFASPEHPAGAQLRIYSVPALNPRWQIDLPDYNPQALQYPGRMVWLPDGRLVYAAYAAPTAPFKTVFTSLDPEKGGKQTLAASEDSVFDWALHDNWLVYSSESGLWAQPVSESGDSTNKVASIQLEDPVITNLDWQLDRK